MIRRSFLQWLSIFSVAGTINKGGQNDPPKSPRPSGDPKGQSGSSQQRKSKDIGNINNLPVVEFDENGNIANYKELLKDKNEVLVFVRREDAFFDLNYMFTFWDEFLLKVTDICFSGSELFLKLETTKNSKKTTVLNKRYCWVGKWKGISNVS